MPAAVKRCIHEGKMVKCFVPLRGHRCYYWRVGVFFATLSYFWTYDNLMDIIGSIAIVTFVAIGVTLSLIVDGFHLSVGATVSDY